MGAIGEFFKGLRVTGKVMVDTVAGDGLVTTQYPKEFRDKPQRFHGRMSSIATPTAWRSASAVSSAPGPARPGASMSGVSTTRPVIRSARASGLVSSTRSTCSVASSARLCVEACPTEAITMTSLFEMSTSNRERRHLHRRTSFDASRRLGPAHVPRRPSGPAFRIGHGRRLASCRLLPAVSPPTKASSPGRGPRARPPGIPNPPRMRSTGETQVSSLKSQVSTSDSGLDVRLTTYHVRRPWSSWSFSS